MAKLLDGKRIAEKILRNLKKEIEKKRLKLKLAVVLVERDRASESFVRQIEKSCKKIGVDFLGAKLPAGSLAPRIRKIVKNPDISGIVVVGKKDFSGLIPPEKNVELSSPVVCAVNRILKEYKISLRRKKVVLVGRGRLVGGPVAEWLKKQKIKFSNIDKSLTFRHDIRKVRDKIKKADIIISGVGKKNLITEDMIKKGAIVIDVGHDVDFEAVSKKAKYITPVPGGVGPVVVACLLQNLVKKDSRDPGLV